MVKNGLKIIYVPIDSIKPNEYNPKQLTKKEAQDLENSIKRFGVVDPLIVNSANNRKNILIGGHQRLHIFKKLGLKEVPVVYVSIPDIDKEQELCLRLSKNLGSWDYDSLVNFGEEQLLDVGFSNEELDEIFGLAVDDEFDVEKELSKVLGRKEQRCKDGDLWQLGSHQLYIGDAVKEENWERVLGNEKFDFLLSDPPYKLAYTQGRFKGWVKTKKGFGYRAQRNYLGVEKKGSVPEYDEWLSIANEFQNPNGANVMIFENWRNTVSLWQAMEKYWKIKNMIIWWLPNRHQGFSRPGYFFQKYDIAPLAGEGILNEDYEEELENYLKEKGQKLLDTYEIILYGNQGEAYWDKKKGTRWARVNDHITWMAEAEKSSGQSVVFGTKPIQILVPYIKILSPRGGVVMDCFAGSGSTIIASEIMKRRCQAIEISEIYSEVILNRWERFTGLKAEKLNADR